ncbi:MAG: hypothetical protein GWN50_07600, partial [Candidatus Dadabacteria bacterium]|nr:hypothetical protein [Candidatus Dadabacteria bacterium]
AELNTPAPELQQAQDLFFNYYKNEANFKQSMDLVQGILENDPSNCEAWVLL